MFGKLGFAIALLLLSGCCTCPTPPEVSQGPEVKQAIAPSPSPSEPVYTAEERAAFLQDVRQIIPLGASEMLNDDVLERGGIEYCEMPEAELLDNAQVLVKIQLEFGIFQSASYYLCPEREDVYLRVLDAAGVEYRDPSNDAQ